MLEDFMTPAMVQSLKAGALGDHVDRFCSHLVDLGYRPCTIREKLWTISALARWMFVDRRTVADLDERRIDDFLEAWRWRGRLRRNRRYGRGTLLTLLRLLRADGVIGPLEPKRDHTAIGALIRRYEVYLRQERALADSTIAYHVSIARRFFGEHVGALRSPLATLDISDVNNFMLTQVRSTPGRAHEIGSCLRSFLRFLFLHGDIKTNLALALPTVRQRRQVNIQRHIPERDVERVLRCAAICSKRAARRDHAILLLLARLGLRAGEVVALELDDLRWRSGEIIVRGKGLVRDRLPLVPEVGRALALYIQKHRPIVASRSVFLRAYAPYRGLGRHATISTIVKHALARAGLAPAAKGAHLFRHSLATTMVRRGATFSEIGQVLRHRSPRSTEIYAKLDFGALRDIALPWPIVGSER